MESVDFVAEALPDLELSFDVLDQFVQRLPEGERAEIVRGVLAMSPRPRPRHSRAMARLHGVLDERLGGAREGSGGETSHEWLFLLEPEVRSRATFSRLIPDVAAWRRSTSGWPEPDENPVGRTPEWVAEILSPSTESDDRGRKSETYGLMGVAWLWLLDLDARRIEVLANERGRMLPHARFGPSGTVAAPPFEGVEVPLAVLFDW